ncbi:MAG: DUF362 domain-containing protein [Deltaproteobacteria bacterium]|nr:DUF362 domain-containing protein [Deltaproteobacteria bacterium]
MNLDLPKGLTQSEYAFPTFFIKIDGLNISNPNTQRDINDVLFHALCRCHDGEISGQAVIKVHIGEPRVLTRMKPEYTTSSVRFLRHRGVSRIVAGDTTVAYSGPRGHKENPPGDAATYVALARQHGWSPEGPAGVPFVVLDRPCTAVPTMFEFSAEEKPVEIQGIHRFNDFFLAGGFAAADFVMNHAHLTLHGLAGVAGCVKSLAMGCSALTGKLRMHQSLQPRFNPDECTQCGDCEENCPEGAIELNDEDPCPHVDPELCIGCGECEAVCVSGAITLQGEDITDWERGEGTLPTRMADYVIGLMDGRWENVINVLHLYTVTERCDCVNRRQEPMLQRNLGFLVGKNPFAIDQFASRMLAAALKEEGRTIEESLLKTAEDSAAYVRETYGILSETPLESISPV